VIDQAREIDLEDLLHLFDLEIIDERNAADARTGDEDINRSQFPD
jgi:hypothetical protein